MQFFISFIQIKLRMISTIFYLLSTVKLDRNNYRCTVKEERTIKRIKNFLRNIKKKRRKDWR